MHEGVETLLPGAERLCHYRLYYDPGLNAEIESVTASSLALMWFRDTCLSGSTSRDFGPRATMATFLLPHRLCWCLGLDVWILFLVDEMESTELLAWRFQADYCSLILALANVGSHGSLTPQSNYKNCAKLAVTDHAEYNFIHLLDVWGFFGILICLWPITNAIFFYSFLRAWSIVWMRCCRRQIRTSVVASFHEKNTPR